MWRRKWHPTPVLLPGKSHGWRSLVGYSPCGCKDSDTTEWLSEGWMNIVERLQQKYGGEEAQRQQVNLRGWMESRVWDSPVVRKADWGQVRESLEHQPSALKPDRRDTVMILERRCELKQQHFRKIMYGKLGPRGPRTWRKTKRLFHSKSI